MLREHFKLGVQPFGVTPDVKFLYLSQTHREALASLFYGIHSGRGFTALIALPGMGKTTLLFHLLGLLSPNAKTAFLFQTLCGPEEFLRSLLADLGIDNQGDIACMHAKLNAYLLQESKNGRQVIVVIDEAQNLDDRVLELIRMLSNFETPGKKLMHLVLSGQPQLAEKLASEHLTQLRQRISIVARLVPFNADETREYIEHRLRVAGAPDKAIFSTEAHAMIAQHSCGIPRIINNLCFNSMSLACALERPQVDASMVRETVGDLDLRSLVARTEEPRVSQPARSLPLEIISAPFTSWSYRLPLAIGLLTSAVFLGGYVWPPRQDSRPSKPATNISQPEGKAGFEMTPPLAVLAPGEGDKLAPPKEAKVPASAEGAGKTLRALASASGASYSPGNPSHRSRDAKTEPRAGENQVPLGGYLDLSPLPEELQRLESAWVAEFTANHQVSVRPRYPSNQSVPFEVATQREKQ
jgi:general secretion pathway protein A